MRACLVCLQGPAEAPLPPANASVLARLLARYSAFEATVSEWPEPREGDPYDEEDYDLEFGPLLHGVVPHGVPY